MNIRLTPARHSETAFESVIEEHLLGHGYSHVQGQFDPARAIFPDQAIAFIRASQPQEWARLEALHGDKIADQVPDGIQAVQTLTRPNRIHSLKEDTFILDFVNDPEEIRAAFKQFYEGAALGDEAEPEQLYQLKSDLDTADIYRSEEVARFCAVYFKPKQRQSSADHQALNAALDPAVDRFKALRGEHEAEAEVWRGKLVAFRNLYAFLSQIIPYQDSDLERLYTFLRHLSAKLPRRSGGPQYDFDTDVYLEYYRLQKISEGSIDLGQGYARPLDGPTEVGTAVIREGSVALSQVIDIVNDRFGTDFNQADQLFFDQIVEMAADSEELQQAAQVNSADKFSLLFKGLLETLFMERMDQNEEVFARYMNDPAFQKIVSDLLGAEVYRRLADDGQTSVQYGTRE